MYHRPPNVFGKGTVKEWIGYKRCRKRQTKGCGDEHVENANKPNAKCRAMTMLGMNLQIVQIT